MKKHLNISISLLIGLLILSLASCDDDNNNNYEVSAEWRQHQDNWAEKIKDAVRDGVYTPLKSESGLGYIYTRSSDFITKNMMGEFDKDGPEALPKVKSTAAQRPIEETDQVQLRYEGWYYNLEDKKVIFDTTESGANGNNAQTAIFTVNGLVDGFKTALLDMEVGEERIVCIPYRLGYGAGGSTSILGYTTLFFDIKILKNVTADAERE